MPIKRIMLIHRRADWHAHISGKPEVWGHGPNHDAAIGNMIRHHSVAFDFEVVDCSGLKPALTGDEAEAAARKAFEDATG